MRKSSVFLEMDRIDRTIRKKKSEVGPARSSVERGTAQAESGLSSLPRKDSLQVVVVVVSAS